MAKIRRWPSLDELVQKAQQGILDDTEDAVPPYDLEDWEIRGEPPPEGHVQAPVRGTEGDKVVVTNIACPAPGCGMETLATLPEGRKVHTVHVADGSPGFWRGLLEVEVGCPNKHSIHVVVTDDKPGESGEPQASRGRDAIAEFRGG